MPMQNRTRSSRATQISLSILAALFLTAAIVHMSAASAATKLPKTAASKGAANDAPDSVDDLQRSLRLDNYRLVADSGPSRGENIYFYKCWMCHNKYTKGGPSLQGTFDDRETLTSGDPMNDENVTARIKEGSGGMPAFSHQPFRCRYRRPARLFPLRKMLRGGRKSSGQSVVSRRNPQVVGAHNSRRRAHRYRADRQR